MRGPWRISEREAENKAYRLEVGFVPQLSVFKVEMKILIPPEILFEET